MRKKDASVEVDLAPVLFMILMDMDEQYRDWDGELVITSGSEVTAKHGYTSLHYAKPARAVDIRSWSIKRIPSETRQLEVMIAIKDKFCEKHNIPKNWIEVILEKTHIHIEYQPKRQYELLATHTGN